MQRLLLLLLLPRPWSHPLTCVLLLVLKTQARGPWFHRTSWSHRFQPPCLFLWSSPSVLRHQSQPSEGNMQDPISINEYNKKRMIEFYNYYIIHLIIANYLRKSYTPPVKTRLCSRSHEVCTLALPDFQMFPSGTWPRSFFAPVSWLPQWWGTRSGQGWSAGGGILGTKLRIELVSLSWRNADMQILQKHTYSIPPDTAHSLLIPCWMSPEEDKACCL